jgi:DNA-binding protein HU-beta
MKSRDDIAADVAADLGLAKGQTESIVKKTFEKIAAALRAGDDVRVNDFGTFSVKDTAARQARNPSTGAVVDVPAGRKVSFKPATTLKKGI